MKFCKGIGFLGMLIGFASYAFDYIFGLVSKLFVKHEVLLWGRSLPVIEVVKSVFSLKPDKVREFFRFLRVKQSWIAG